MNETDHLALARDYIAKGEDFYRRAAEEIVAAQRENPTLSYRAIGERVGKKETWVGDLVRWFTSGRHAEEPSPFSGSEYRVKKETQATKRTLREAEPETIREIVNGLPRDAAENLARAATDTLVGRARAERAEHNSQPTVGSLSEGECFDPSESWADTLIIRTNRNARELSKHVRQWGLVLGSMPQDEAFEYLRETEGLIAEIRAAVGERVQDGVVA